MMKHRLLCLPLTALAVAVFATTTLVTAQETNSTTAAKSPAPVKLNMEVGGRKSHKPARNSSTFTSRR